MRLRWSFPQVARRALQLGVVAFIVYSAMGGAWRNYKVAHNHRRLVTLMEGEFWGTLYGLNEDVLSWLGEPYRASLDFLGLPWAGRVLGLDTADPMLVAGQAVAGDVSAGLWLSLLIPLGLATLFGKVFCSHLCPMRLAFELAEPVRKGLLRLGLPLAEWRSNDRYGGWVLVGGLLGTAVAGPAVWLFVLPYVSLAASIFLAITTGALSVLASVVLFWFVVDVALAPGFFCHNLCPTGFALEQFGRLARLRIRKDESEPCPASCNVCEQTCPYSLQPKQNVPMSACDRCGRCVSACPSNKLSRGLVQISGTLALVLFISLAGAPPATAHHNKGIPHYGYFENYPQAPVEEYVVIDGPWEMGAVVFNFQGLDRTSADTPNDVKIYLYLYDNRTGSAYEGPLEVEIRSEGELVSTFTRLKVDEEAVYSTRETLPHSGDYELLATVGEEQVSLTFHVDLASDRLPVAWIGGIGGSAVLLFGLSSYGRKRRRRRRRRPA